MSKKEYIVMILTALESDRSLAKDLKKFVLLDKFDNQALDGLVDFFRQGYTTVKTSAGKARMKKSIEILNKIQELEKADQLQNEQECEKLQDMLQHL